MANYMQIYLFIYLLLACKSNGEKNYFESQIEIEISNLNNYAKFM